MTADRDDPPAGFTAPDSDLSTRMQLRVELLENRLKDLTERVEAKEKSVFKRISEWAGLIALIVAIAGGGFAVYDKLFVNPKKDREVALSQLQDILGDLTKTNAELVRLSRQLPPDQFALIASLQNGVKLSLARRAAAIIEQHSDEIDAATMLVISYEFQQFEKLDVSRRLAQMALHAADSDLLRAEAKRYIADAIILQGGRANIAQARATYEEGLVLARKMPGLQGISVIGNIYRDWILGESLGDNCEQARKLFEAMRVELAAPKSLVAMRTSAAQVANFLRDKEICQYLVSDLEKEQ